MAIKGSFYDDQGNEYQYRVTAWFENKGQDYPKRHTGYQYSQHDFYYTDRLWVESRKIDPETGEPGESRYTTVQGPFADQSFIEDILEYDYSQYTKQG
jgi:hypothetical protein